MVKQLIYKSTSMEPITKEMVEKILLPARRFNAEYDITGLLLFSEDVFLQFLEGKPEDVDLLYKRICHDPRHKDIAQLYTGYSDNRNYPDWRMMSYSRHQVLSQNPSDVYIFARNLMDPIADDQPTDIGTFMKMFCNSFLPESPPDKSSFN